MFTCPEKKSTHVYCSSNRVIIHGSDAAIIPQLSKKFYKLNQTNNADCLTTAASSCSKIKKNTLCLIEILFFLIKQRYFCFLAGYHHIATYQYVIFFFLKNASR